MKMKLFLMGLLLSMVCSVSANITDPDLNENKKGQGGGGPRSITPTVELSSQGNLLIFDLSHYVGDVDVNIFTAGLIGSAYIYGDGTLIIDVTGIDSGYHEFTLTLSNGITYSGHFMMN